MELGHLEAILEEQLFIKMVSKLHSPNIPLEKMKEFEDRMKNFQYLRQNRASLYQGIFVALLTSALILIVNLISKNDIYLQTFLIVLLIFLSLEFYKFSLRQTQKPIFVAENARGTIEGKPVLVKDKKGNGYYIFSLSDFSHNPTENNSPSPENQTANKQSPNN